MSAALAVPLALEAEARRGARRYFDRALPAGLAVVSANNPRDGALVRAHPDEDKLRARRCGPNVTTRYGQRLHRADDNFILETVVFNPVGPQCVWSEAPDGTRQQWPHRWEADKTLVFRAPDGYAGGMIFYWYTHAQIAEPIRLRQTTVYSFSGEDKGHV